MRLQRVLGQLPLAPEELDVIGLVLGMVEEVVDVDPDALQRLYTPKSSRFQVS